MTRYDDLFDELAADESVFADKGALDPLAEPEDIVPWTEQERALGRILTGVTEDYLPTTVSIYGPPGTGKTITTQRLCQEFADRQSMVGVEYVNLKECRTIFSAANEILFALGGEKEGAYVGLDGVFEAIWERLEEYPEWTVLILDEIDHIQHDANYDPSDFFYRLLRGEGKLERELQLSVFLISNELLTVDLRLDSRVESAMGGEEVFFPPYDEAELRAIIGARIEVAFVDGGLSEEAFDRGVQEAAYRWGDARRTLRLFRQAGELATERKLDRVTVDCLLDSLEGTERETTVAKLRSLPLRHLVVLAAAVGTRGSDGKIIQPVRSSRIHERLQQPSTAEQFRLGERAIQKLVGELDTMGLVESWTESKGRAGRAMYVETTFDPEWVYEAQAAVAERLLPAEEY
ncbi:ORC1-type DNA replication protein [Halalkalicoccus paucihalophilus]|uniref:ORC1-type DNA replication protein n=1 Tax=Halalkalicoccus paucihalophilus TaxID=1008153 RepID=A0A151ABR4_9EURY|nr:AAA family ATPase [Halalkalicoccus paucihalophilus]KYH25034.1 ORC1-type DNA replication protein [Halalkalicoccus paucihalophilus]